MALRTKLDFTSPEIKELEHVSPSITDGNLVALISGITDKRIKIWRLHSYVGTASKVCALLSGTNAFPSLDSAKSLVHELKSSDGIPVFTCNAGEDFKADPSDTTNWYFYIVYSIE